MANQLKMATVDAIVSLAQAGWAQRRIARELGIDRETVARYVQCSQADSKPATNAPSGSQAVSRPRAGGPCGPQSRCEPLRQVSSGVIHIGFLSNKKQSPRPQSFLSVESWKRCGCVLHAFAV